jgi:diguanylate cyclase
LFDRFDLLNLNYIFIVLSIMLNSLGLYFALGSNFYRKRRLISLPLSNRIIFVLVSILISTSNVLMLLSLNMNLLLRDLYFSFMWVIAVNMITFFIYLKLTKINIVIPLKNLITSIFITVTIIIKNLIISFFLFERYVQIKLPYFIFASLLTIGLSFSLLRFKAQMEQSEKSSISQSWGKLGSMMSGVAAVGIYYLYMNSIVEIPALSGAQMDYFLLIGAIIILTINLILVLLPDILGHNSLIESENKLQINREYFKSLFNHNPDAVFSIDLKGKIISVNKVAVQMTCYRREELLGMYFSRLVKRDDVKEFIRYYQNEIGGKENIFEIRLVRKDRQIANVKITSIPIYVKDEIIGFYSIVKDVTESDEAQRTINYLAYHDELTNLPNRRLYTKKLHLLKNKSIPFAIMNLDFDRFKRINDLFGHAFGDQVLVEIADRLKNLLGDQYFIARMGGDEFCVIVQNEHNRENLTQLAEFILNEFRKPLKVKNHDCLITASIGIVLFPEQTTDLEALVKYSDIAMYDVKENGANDFKIYDDGMNDKTIEKIKLENDLRRAIVSNELTIHYQPKFHAKTKGILGAEALVRWNHPTFGLISPGKFIPLAEETGLIVQLEEWVLESVCEQIKQWQDTSFDYGRISVNISHIHFYQSDLVQTILKILSKKGLAANCLEIEITETTMMHNESETNKTLQQLREIGIEVSMDDFGTGYSSLGYLHRLSIDRLKIDKSFIHEMYKNEAIVSTIISMAQHLQLKVIAEGVETDEQLNLITKLGCEEIQGFYFSKPLSSEDFETQILKPLLIS